MSERSSDELAAAEQRIFDRRWAIRAERRPVDAYELGWLDGVHQALRWALGDGDEIENASLDT